MKDLSVVVASVNAAASIERCLSGFERTCRNHDSEIVVVDASQDETAEIVAARFPEIRLLKSAIGTLTPELWTKGYQVSRGRVVAFTVGQCVPAVQWAAAMLDATSRGASGVGGPLTVADDASRLDCALFYLRYSAFTSEMMTAGRTSGEVAGDNACYRREWLDRFASSFAEGFWEIDFHRALRSSGGWLAAEPRAQVTFGSLSSAKTICRHRFAHGRHFGSGRVHRGGRSPWLIVGGAPIVPLLLAWRAYRRVGRLATHRWRFLRGLPWFFLLAACWAAGEACGAFGEVLGASSSPRPDDDTAQTPIATGEAPRT
jgi:hypothetical protein